MQRRLFLLEAARLSAAVAGAALVLPAPAAARDYPFSLGVASGSPLPHAVVIGPRRCVRLRE